MKLDDLLYTHASKVMEHFTLKTQLPLGTKSNDIVSLIRDHAKILSAAQLFLVEQNFYDYKEEKLDGLKVDHLDYALPFKTCFFELNDKDLGLSEAKSEDGSVSFGIHALLVDEVFPLNYKGWLFVERDEVPDAIPFLIGPSLADTRLRLYAGMESHHLAPRKTEMEQWTCIAGLLLDKLCTYIHSCHLGVEPIYRTVNMKTRTLGKNLHKINHIIRLKPMTHTDYPEPAFSREIDWDMRWWVRGHWRKLPSAETPGKDRAGNYNVKGFTWVIEHLRGPEDKPIRKSTYKLEPSCHP